MTAWLEQVNWGNDGLLPVITQEFSTKQVLTLASLFIGQDPGKNCGIKVNNPAISKSSNLYVLTVIRMPFCLKLNR